MLKYIVTDIETNGLLNNVTKFWCAWIYDSVKKEYKGYTNLKDYFNSVNNYGIKGYTIVGHNFIKYDIPCLKKLMGRDFDFDPWVQVRDTLVMGRLIYSNVKDIDVGLMKSGRLPKRLYGAHSLKAYGYRLGELKGSYGEQEEAWDSFNEQMYTYCKQDVHVTKVLYEKLISKGYPEESIELEHQIAWVMAKQERNGFVFDKDNAYELYSELVAKRESLEKHLGELFGSWKVSLGFKTYKRDNAKLGIKAGVPVEKFKEVTFNPNSRQHIAKVLIERGWKPSEFTPTGQPKVDESTLEPIKNLEGVKDILEYLLIEKRIAQLAEGDNAWLKLMTKDDDGITRIHGSVNPNGAVTGRATHAYPNVAQVPSGHSPYGRECRSLFGVPKGWYQAGIDASGLELRCFGHFLYPYDRGSYIHTILNGDIHTANQQAAGLPTRDNAKTFIYGFLYGAGDGKIGEIVGKDAKEGKRLREKFLKAIPAIQFLRDDIERTLIASQEWIGGSCKVHWRKRFHPKYKDLNITHCLVGLDGRPVFVRSPHSALNTLLQSAGALVCKAWVVAVEKNMRKAGYKHGWDGDFALMAWVHDEVQIACRNKEIANEAVRIAQESMREVQQKFKFNCQLDTEGIVGKNWCDCH